MKNKILFFILFFVTIGYLFCQDNDTIIGKVVSINNPCTTDPCLPGRVFALQSDTLSYILTIDHKWNIDSFNVDGRYIKVDDSIQVIGIIYEKVDLKDKIYYEIEIEEVLFFDTTTIENKNDTLISKVVSINNPCTTDPCLPGGVLALQSDTLSYILTIDHKWNIDSFNVDGRYIKIDDSIQVIGIIYEKVDLKDKIYYEIEIEQVFFFDITTIKNNKNTQIEIFPNPTNGIIYIKNAGGEISSICLIDLNGKTIVTVKDISSPIIEIDNISFKGILLCKATLQNNQNITTKIIIK